MMNNITQNLCRIDCHADKQEPRPVVPGMAADKKSANIKQNVKKQTKNIHLYFQCSNFK